MLVHAALGLLLLVAEPQPRGNTATQASPATRGHLVTPGKAPGNAAATYLPAPIPDRQFDLPRPREQKDVELVPALTDTGAYVPLGNGYSSGSAFHAQLTRHSQPLSQIGSQLAPGLTLHIPLH